MTPELTVLALAGLLQAVQFAAFSVAANHHDRRLRMDLSCGANPLCAGLCLWLGALALGHMGRGICGDDGDDTGRAVLGTALDAGHEGQ